MACRIFLVGQGFIPCRQIFSARCKTAPYIEPILSGGMHPARRIFHFWMAWFQRAEFRLKPVARAKTYNRTLTACPVAADL